MTIAFSAATLDDLPAVVDLCMLVEEQHENYWPLRWKRRSGLAEGYLRWLSRRIDDPRMFIHVAKDSEPASESPLSREPKASAGPGQIVGMILVSINDEIPIYTYSEFALIQDMAVIESHRRRGIAQQLLKNAAAWARSHHLTQLRLMVAHHNPTARTAFEKAGFRPTYTEMVLPLDDQN
jgi:GNAT superfamily N-acetyltransferase